VLAVPFMPVEKDSNENSIAIGKGKPVCPILVNVLYILFKYTSNINFFFCIIDMIPVKNKG